MEPWGCKKKLTPIERFAFRLCLSLGVVHPDYLLPALTWEQFRQWQQYSEEEPWGETRADQRTLAQTAWLKAAGQWNGDLPELVFPYFQSADSGDVMAQKAELDRRAAEIKEKMRRK